MKKIAVILMGMSLVVAANASEICEIGTVAKPYNEGIRTIDLVDINCTNFESIPNFTDLDLNYFYSTNENGSVRFFFAITDRVKVKQVLINAKYRLSATCGAYETFIKP